MRHRMRLARAVACCWHSGRALRRAADGGVGWRPAPTRCPGHAWQGRLSLQRSTPAWLHQTCRRRQRAGKLSAAEPDGRLLLHRLALGARPVGRLPRHQRRCCSARARSRSAPASSAADRRRGFGTSTALGCRRRLRPTPRPAARAAVPRHRLHRPVAARRLGLQRRPGPGRAQPAALRSGSAARARHARASTTCCATCA